MKIEFPTPENPTGQFTILLAEETTDSIIKAIEEWNGLSLNLRERAEHAHDTWVRAQAEQQFAQDTVERLFSAFRAKVVPHEDRGLLHSAFPRAFSRG